MISFLTDGWSAQSISAINAVLAWAAFIIHSWAASRTSGWLRKMFVMIGSLALFYSFAYWWLFFNPERVTEWSNALRPLGIFTWIIAWSVEPIILVIYLARRGDEIVRKAQDVADQASHRLDRSDP